MPEDYPAICMPCEKGNHEECLVEVVDVKTTEVVICKCGPCEEANLRAQQSYYEPVYRDGYSDPVGYFKTPGYDGVEGTEWRDRPWRV